MNFYVVEQAEQVIYKNQLCLFEMFEISITIIKYIIL